MVVALEREVLEGRAQILPDRQDVAVDLAERLERLGQLVARLAETDHQRALGVDRVADLAGHRLGVVEDAEAALPAGALADRLLEPPDGLEVVVEDVGPGVHHGAQRGVGAVEVGDEDLDAHPGRGLAHPADRLGEDARAAVGQVVAGDAGDHHVLQAEPADRLGDASRLVVVEPGRLAGLDRAEAAGPGAGVAQDHDRGGALVPALPDVRAVGLLADRVEREAAQEPLQLVVVLARRQPGPDPVGVTAEGRRAVGGRLARQAATERDRRHLGVMGAGVTAVVGAEHRELAGHGGSVRRGSRPGPVSRLPNASRTPTSKARGANPSSATALAFEPQ